MVTTLSFVAVIMSIVGMGGMFMLRQYDLFALAVVLFFGALYSLSEELNKN